MASATIFEDRNCGTRSLASTNRRVGYTPSQCSSITVRRTSDGRCLRRRRILLAANAGSHNGGRIAAPQPKLTEPNVWSGHCSRNGGESRCREKDLRTKRIANCRRSCISCRKLLSAIWTISNARIVDTWQFPFGFRTPPQTRTERGSSALTVISILVHRIQKDHAFSRMIA